jgi:hypothetical protein
MAIHLLVPHVLDLVHDRRVAAVLVAHGLAHGLEVEGLAVRVEHHEGRLEFRAARKVGVIHHLVHRVVIPARGMACHSAIV